MSQLILFNKPYGVLCQFTDPEGRPTLADYIKTPGVYAAGRLDFDSEGLLLLTDDGQLQHQIAHPRNKLPKVYWAQVEGEVTPEALSQLQKGVSLKDGITAPAGARVIAEPDIWLRQPPIRERKSIPTSWIELTIREGRNRQVRRMTAAVGFPTLRLIRRTIGDWSVAGLALGETRIEVVESAPEAQARAGKPGGKLKASGRTRSPGAAPKKPRTQRGRSPRGKSPDKAAPRRGSPQPRRPPR